MLSDEQQCETSFSLLIIPRHESHVLRSRTGINFKEKRFVFRNNVAQCYRHRRRQLVGFADAVEDCFVKCAVIILTKRDYEKVKLSHLVVFEMVNSLI